MYAQAARVTSKYPYEPGAIQLNKHASTAAMLIFDDILTAKNKSDNDKRQARNWLTTANAVGSCIWLLVFFDSLLFWEEQQQHYKGNSHQHFVEVLKPSHPNSISKLLSCLAGSIRKSAIRSLESPEKANDPQSRWHATLRSKRMESGSLLNLALLKPKVAIGEMDMSMIFADDEDLGGAGRRSKRARRNDSHRC